jgi:hypothetical protein
MPFDGEPRHLTSNHGRDSLRLPLNFFPKKVRERILRRNTAGEGPQQSVRSQSQRLHAFGFLRALEYPADCRVGVLGQSCIVEEEVDKVVQGPPTAWHICSRSLCNIKGIAG